FRFAKIAHEALGIEYEFSKKDNAFKSDFLRLEFEMPHRAIKMAHIADALVVDEVAAIPFPFLRKTIGAYKKIVFSGTVHGYEGTGRIFAVRFLKILEETKKKFYKVELDEPIRYAENDPIEKWLFDILLLDAEPLPIDEGVLREIDKAKLIEIDPKKYFLEDEKYESFLRSLIGILTTAHYRNNPKDLLLMSDAPHHRMFALVIHSVPVVALQIAEEGEIPEDKIQELIQEAPPGHLIPDNVTRYTGLVEIPLLKGFRIVRIATHPSLQGHGLGSLALKKLSERARKEGALWIGASFGANPRLLNFWLKNKFLAANMSPIINPKTGEYSIIVMKPLAKRAKRLILEANKQLKIRLLRELRNSYWELETETAHMILKMGDPIEVIPQLNTGDIFRLGLYTRFGGKIEACIDVIDEIVKIYFARMYSFLSREEEILLVKKICQRRLIEKEELIKIRKIVKKLWESIIRIKIKGKKRKSKK
ncbi:MAG: GNAT family N-acetyltransferase, partial [Candidatus Njordarchaeota archaeon]